MIFFFHTHVCFWCLEVSGVGSISKSLLTHPLSPFSTADNSSVMDFFFFWVGGIGGGKIWWLDVGVRSYICSGRGGGGGSLTTLTKQPAVVSLANTHLTDAGTSDDGEIVYSLHSSVCSPWTSPPISACCGKLLTDFASSGGLSWTLYPEGGKTRVIRKGLWQRHCLLCWTM